jgi:PhnB protein
MRVGSGQLEKIAMHETTLNSDRKQPPRERTSVSAVQGFTRRQFVASAAGLAVLPTYAISKAERPKTRGDEMTTLTPYLLFDGSCREAMEFYHSVFGGELSMTKVSESPTKDQMPAFQQSKTINARLKSSSVEISASDWLMPDRTPVRGNTVCLFLSGGTFPELKSLFDKLSDGAKVTDPLKEVFFGFYGALNDRFGIRWMFQANQQNG